MEQHHNKQENKVKEITIEWHELGYKINTKFFDLISPESQTTIQMIVDNMVDYINRVIEFEKENLNGTTH